MSIKPQVSVCIPAYNHEKFIGAAISSVLNQSFDDFELIVVDDCSKDSTVGVARSFTDPRLRLIQNPKNLGMVHNWNRCVELANAPVVCLLHGDDLYKPGFLRTVISMLEGQPSVGLAFCAWTWLDESTDQRLTIQPVQRDTVFDSRAAFAMFLRENPTIPAAVAVRKSVLERVGRYNTSLRYGPDWEMWLRICACYPVAYHSRPLVTYRTHSGSMTSNLRQQPCVLAKEELAVLRSTCRLALTKLGLGAGFCALYDARRYVADRQFHRAFWYARCNEWRRFRIELYYAFWIDPSIVLQRPFLRAWHRSYRKQHCSMTTLELAEYGVYETPLGL